jgi:hypothetical protein
MRLRSELPFQIRGIDSDNGSEFLNESLIGWCEANGVEFTRSRPYHKNDQAWVEQKNGAIVRRLVGYHRLAGLGAASALGRLYAVSRLFQNFFQPSFKLAEKVRIGARVSKKYHAAATPCARLLDDGAVTTSVKEGLRSAAAALDPIRLLDEMRSLQEYLRRLAAGEETHLCPPSDARLERFLASLSTAWQQGEVRPTHCRPERPPRHWRTRKDPFELVWPQVVAWLEAEPDLTAKNILHRLQREHDRSFPGGQLRTLQRRVKEWRRAEARRLIVPAPGISNGGGDGLRPNPGDSSRTTCPQDCPTS